MIKNGCLLSRSHMIGNHISELLPLQKKFKDLKAQLELKSYDVSLFQSRSEQNEHHKLGEHVKRIEQELLEAKSAAKEKQLLYEKCIADVSMIEKLISEHANNWDGRLNDLEKNIRAHEAQVQSASKDLKYGHENEKERLTVEMETVKQECAPLESQLVSLKKQIDRLTLEVDELKTRIASIRNAHDQAQSELNIFRSKMECDTQISCILREQLKLQPTISEMNLERTKMENEVRRMEMEQKDCSLKVQKLIEKHTWITSQK
ncbi:structural maintenance of chromosomes protein 2-1-like [Actinidia eriantha]|uniref:structural maintenance of chromosomes protein 2-1-like n=1 Tax=Actinidia eriantha TaxID=165200 RepID=UPI00258FD66A|nr:structural maintenance of chromosomes protein 2-1-like [Actinidia eriantha]